MLAACNSCMWQVFRTYRALILSAKAACVNEGKDTYFLEARLQASAKI